MANYKITSTTEVVQWPAYVSTVTLKGEQLEKAERVLDKALVTLEGYGGPAFTILNLKAARKTAIFLYEIFCDLEDSKGELKGCLAMILHEPWMKANSIAVATFEFATDEGVNVERLVMKRKKSIKYYKDTEVAYEEGNNLAEQQQQQTVKFNLKAQRITDV